ncbi:Sir2 family NAD-dependent protein deacetylase [Blastococcus sp. CT_GayMR19]|uniref:SIR2 family NAD-dependent protein deacylase n=1 Tax=Blastococcus sp. CT_GayMR19 TaxID=2559608 RepID=UPI002474B19B|nr:Sir2 family NAD-dependent protein deacetylase [Blastococcus sp. CT_GayMR19]
MTGAVPLPGWLTGARRICVLSGAGISTDSGIPDYRGPNGLWTRDPDAEKLVTLSYYLADPEIRRRSWLLRQAMRDADPRPNAGHAALVGLERQGRLRALITQNIDGLHQAAGSSPDLSWRSTAPCTRWSASAAATGRRCPPPSPGWRRVNRTRPASCAAAS